MRKKTSAAGQESNAMTEGHDPCRRPRSVHRAGILLLFLLLALITTATNAQDDSAASANQPNFLASLFAFLWSPILSLWTFFATSSIQGPRCDYTRCGFGGLFFVQVTGTPGSPACRETCVSTPLSNGRCDATCGPVVPTISPAPTILPPPTPRPVTPKFFDITLDMSLVPILDRTYFDQAAARWEKVIIGDLPNVNTDFLKPKYNGCSYPSVVDDLYICAQYGTIDVSVVDLSAIVFEIRL